MRMIVKLYLDKILAGDITLGGCPKETAKWSKERIRKGSTMKIRKAFLFFLLDVFFKEEAAMLVRLYASEIILEKITIDDVPNKLKDKVRKYLEDMGYEV